VTFTKVLTTYQSRIHLLHHSPLSSFLHSWDSFNRPHFSIFIHEYIIFLPHSPSHTLSFCPSPSHWHHPQLLRGQTSSETCLWSSTWGQTSQYHLRGRLECIGRLLATQPWGREVRLLVCGKPGPLRARARLQPKPAGTFSSLVYWKN
jgi:hypothetical protein